MKYIDPVSVVAVPLTCGRISLAFNWLMVN